MTPYPSLSSTPGRPNHLVSMLFPCQNVKFQTDAGTTVITLGEVCQNRASGACVIASRLGLPDKISSVYLLDCTDSTLSLLLDTSSSAPTTENRLQPLSVGQLFQSPTSPFFPI